MDDQQRQALQQQAAAQPVQRDGDTMDDKILDLDQVKNEIREALSGYRLHKVYNEDKQAYELQKVQINDRNLCNEECVEDIMATIDGTVNHNIAGSYLTEHDINDMGLSTMESIIYKLRANYRRYDINGPDEFYQIVSIVFNNVKAILNKAKNGRLLVHGEQQTERRIVKTEEETEDSGLLT